MPRTVQLAVFNTASVSHVCTRTRVHVCSHVCTLKHVLSHNTRPLHCVCWAGACETQGCARRQRSGRPFLPLGPRSVGSRGRSASCPQPGHVPGQVRKAAVTVACKGTVGPDAAAPRRQLLGHRQPGQRRQRGADCKAEPTTTGTRQSRAGDTTGRCTEKGTSHLSPRLT